MSAKKKAVKKPAKKTAPAKAGGSFQPGQRVKVSFGDYGNARGTVERVSPTGAVSVLLDNNVRAGAQDFRPDQLQAL